MNLLENYIIEIHSEEPYEIEDLDKSFVKVDITKNCYGTYDRITNVFEANYWERIKEKGYYMG